MIVVEKWLKKVAIKFVQLDGKTEWKNKFLQIEILTQN